ncbi:hypothetical protein SDJN02_17561, partial [Cucurbita argyrosperma subsp. argyrosperma]
PSPVPTRPSPRKRGWRVITSRHRPQSRPGPLLVSAVGGLSLAATAELLMDNKRLKRITSALSPLSSCSSLYEQDNELKHMQLASSCLKNKKRLSKQLSMCETPRDLAWEKRRRQMLRPRNGGSTDRDDLTDEDWNELKGCIELGFAFNEEDGHKLCGTLPALDLYFAVNRQLSPSPVSTPHSSTSTSSSLGGRGSSCESPRGDCETWRVCSPGQDPKQVKAKLRHWAQAVACSVMQSLGEK